MTRAAGVVLVVGDANADLVLRGDVVPRFGQAEQLLDGADLTIGGSASIVAAGLARLATPVRLVARVGDDVLGRATVDALRDRGVDVTGVAVDATLPTGVSVVLSGGDDRAILTLPGTIPSLRGSAVADALLSTVAHVHVASYFLQPALAGDLPELLRRARRAGCTISLDTNWDPAAEWAGVTALLPLVDVFLPNVAELQALTGGAGAGTEPAAALEGRAQALHDLGPVVAVKAGPDGAWAVAAGTVERVAALAVEMVDTTGAGDSFDAGFVAAWVRRLPLADCLRWGVAAGSLSTRGPGGTVAQPTLGELEAALA